MLTDEEKEAYKGWTMIDFNLVYGGLAPDRKRAGSKTDEKKLNEIKEYIREQQKAKRS